MPTKKLPVVCGCIERVNEALSCQGAELDISFHSYDDIRVIVKTQHRYGVRKSKKLIALAANFCPFCGVKYVYRPIEKEHAKAKKKRSK